MFWPAGGKVVIGWPAWLEGSPAGERSGSASYTHAGRAHAGHAEAVEVWLDPAQVSYAELLQTFWRIHNPTTRNRQGFDFGSQYCSAIFHHDAGQMEAAIASRDAEQQSLRRQIVTQIAPASAFGGEEAHGGDRVHGGTERGQLAPGAGQTDLCALAVA